MNIVLRCDSSLQIGSGHVVRCLTLASHLRKLGFHCVFVVKNHPGNAHHLITDAGFDLIELDLTLDEIQESQATLEIGQKLQTKAYIVDHYGLGTSFERGLFSNGRVIVIDDLANRAHLCHALLDINYTVFPDRYKGLVPPESQLLLGPRYALLRDEFFEIRDTQNYVKSRLEKLRQAKRQKILCFFGGTDPSGETWKLYESLKSQKGSHEWTLVVSKSHRDLRRFAHAEEIPGVNILIGAPSMAQAMSEHTAYFGSGGTVTWERMFLGLPGFVATVADNQRPAISSLAQSKLTIDLGEAQKLDYEKTVLYIDENLQYRQELLLEQALKGMNLVTGINAADIRAII